MHFIDMSARGSEREGARGREGEGEETERDRERARKKARKKEGKNYSDKTKNLKPNRFPDAEKIRLGCQNLSILNPKLFLDKSVT